ncbi:MAG: sigma-70 family RNA polymerase sigma factor [Gemmataceae bacterium]|nr:sigma-70 family RNA polymerase sigma factor [Gemmataceae bacterium]
MASTVGRGGQARAAAIFADPPRPHALPLVEWRAEGHPMPDADDLIRRCREGDGAAREELFARYAVYLKVLAKGQIGARLRGKCDASDVVQLTLLEAHRDFGTFQGAGEAELLAWLRRILAHNLCNEARHFATQQRDAGREVAFDQLRQGVDQSSLLLAAQLQANGPSPSQQAQAREASVLMAEAIARLPEDYQEVLLLRIFEELPAEEVAQRMGRTAGAVRMLQMRALEALRAEIG